MVVCPGREDSAECIASMKSPTYRSWRAMIQRCQSPSYHARHLYQGVKICDRWRIFENFLADMGERPPGMSLDRYPNVKGDYEPGNCRWATPMQQANNRRSSRLIEVPGVGTKTAAEWSRVSGVSGSLITQRIDRDKKSPADAIFG